MKLPIDHDDVALKALQAFLLASRREHAARFPDVPNRVPSLEALTPADRASMLKAMKVTLRVAEKARAEGIP